MSYHSSCSALCIPCRYVFRGLWILSHPTLIFGSCSVQSSAGRSSIVTEVFRGFPQSLKANAGLVPLLSHYCHFPNPFQVSNFIIRPHVVSLVTASLNNQQKICESGVMIFFEYSCLEMLSQRFLFFVVSPVLIYSLYLRLSTETFALCCMGFRNKL